MRGEIPSDWWIWVIPTPHFELGGLLEFVPLGLVGLTEDEDHFIRSQALIQKVEGRKVQQLTVAMLEIASKVRPADDGRSLRVQDRPVPLDPSGRVRINYVGPTGTIPRLSFRDLLAAAVGGPEPLDQRGRPFDWEGAFVIIGATAPSRGDLHSTP